MSIFWIFYGAGGGNLDPEGILTRVQVTIIAIMLMRFDAADTVA